ncbi:MAG TPA: serine hydroxymethyltransferase [Patescibacteria group bacterium]|jgi:glycine hydroxymethyltransferase|nr:serine hydroxymethyltransferase [Patescibacteria group bacterium]
MYLKRCDPEIALLVEKESERQQCTINLIASENYVSRAVLEATGSFLTNKYAEGYPHKRYYAGCAIVDQIEQIAIDRCKQLFEAEHANVQPHAGSQANMAAYAALLNPGDTILGMNLLAGGHLTHGHRVNFSGRWFTAVQYGVAKDSELLNFEEIALLAAKHKPKLIIAGASAYSRIIDFHKFRMIADDVGAYLLVDIAHIAGLVAAKLHPSPVGVADIVTSTTHKTLRGPRGGIILSKKDYEEKIDKTIIPGMQGGPLLHIIAAKAVAFKEAMDPNFVDYQKQILTNAKILASCLQQKGYRIVTGGTDNHLLTVDIRNKKMNGDMAQNALEKVGITVNKNCIPFDPEKPWITSGIRLGTPAITSRGMAKNEVEEIAHLIDMTLSNYENHLIMKAVKDRVTQLTALFPIPNALQDVIMTDCLKTVFEVFSGS